MLNKLPIESQKLVVENRKLQKEYLRLRLELNGTSSQDEFAKWAKLRRQHDKALEKLEQKSASHGTPSRNPPSKHPFHSLPALSTGHRKS